MGETFFKKNNLRKLSLVIIVGLVLSFLQGPLLVSEAKGEAKTVRVGYYENDIFEEGASEDAVKSGYAYEYYMKLSEYTGWRYEYVYGSFNELYQMLEDGDIDMLAGLAYMEDRVDYISYPQVAMGSESYNLIKHTDDDSITGEPSSVEGHTIGVLDTAVAEALNAYLISHEITADVIRFTDSERLFSAFDNGDIELLATEGAGTLYKSNYEVLLTFGLSDFYICVNGRRDDLLAELNDAQTQLFDDEPYFRSALSSKYYSSSVSVQAFSPIERNWLESHNTLTVGYLNNYLPYSDTDANGEVTGVVKDVIPQIFYLINVDGININYVGYDTYDELIGAINTDKIDVAFPVGGGLYYSEVNGIYQTNSLASSTTNLIYKNVVVNPNAATFAINSNNTMQYYYVMANFPDAQVKYYNSTAECMDAVLNDEVDCTTLNGLRANEILKNSEYKKLSIRQLSASDERGIGVKIGNEGLLRILNRGIHKLGTDYIENIAYKYTDGLYIYSFTDWFHDHIIVINILLSLIVLTMGVALIYKTRALRKGLVRYENANKNQALFINNIADSIKEPIDEISSLSKMALQITDDEKLLKKSLTKIATSSDVVLISVDEIVDYNLLDKRKLSLKEDKANIVEILKDIERNLTKKANKNKINLTIEAVDIRNKEIVVDRERLAQALTNILENGLDYTPSGGNVSLIATESPCTNPGIAKLNFTIKDDGIGMSEEFQPNAFVAFTKEEKRGFGNANGAGLGLAISQKLIKLMGGTIKLQSKKEQGSEFIIKMDCKIYYKK